MMKIGTASERDLVRRLKLRDPKANDEFVREYGDDLDYYTKSLANTVAGSDVTPKDLFQTTFLKAMMNIGTFRGPGLKTWLRSIARNEAFMVDRHLKVREKVEVEDNRSLEWMVTEFKPTDYRVIAREARETIDNVFKERAYSEAKQFAIREKIKKDLGCTNLRQSDINVKVERKYGVRLRITEIWPVFLAHCEEYTFRLGMGL